jgi:hypothetical protein
MFAWLLCSSFSLSAALLLSDGIKAEVGKSTNPADIDKQSDSRDTVMDGVLNLDEKNDTLWSRRIESALKVPPGKTLVIYSGPTAPASTNEKHRMYHQHLRFFMEHGLENVGPEVQTIVVTTQTAQVDPVLLAKRNGVTWLTREDRCYDLESYRIGLEHIAGNRDKFKYFVFLNCGLAGPFLPSYTAKFGLHWSKYFHSLLNHQVKLAGLSINCGGKGNKKWPHVQSMLWATDFAGLSIINEYMRRGANISLGFVERKMPTVECISDNRQSTNKMDRDVFIALYEMGLSKAIVDAGYKIDAVNAWQQGSVPMDATDCPDIWYQGSYNNSTITPFDGIFIKRTRFTTPEIDALLGDI